MPISLQHIGSEKSHIVHPNKLKKRYTLIPMTMHIVKYLRSDIVKLVDLSRLISFLQFALQPSVKMQKIPPSDDSYPICKILGFYSGSIQVPKSCSILPISLQQIEYEKNYAVLSNELGESYTLIPTTIFIDNYWGAKFRTSIFPNNSNTNIWSFFETKIPYISKGTAVFSKTKYMILEKSKVLRSINF